MRKWIIMRAAIVVGLIALNSPALAQSQTTVHVPGVLAPVPLPPQPAVNPQPPGALPRLDTFSDRMARCLHFGATQGLQAGARDAYSRACANN
jgi:hypothetical protein